jgi:hypothetical protein
MDFYYSLPGVPVCDYHLLVREGTVDGQLILCGTASYLPVLKPFNGVTSHSVMKMDNIAFTMSKILILESGCM